MNRHGPSSLADPFFEDTHTNKYLAATSDDVRIDLVARVRREIADGVYETPEKWEIALERLLDRVDQA
jgi:hypothetical protein